MKVLTARTDVSYLRDYKTRGGRGMRGSFFVPSGSFLCFSYLPLLYHKCIAFVFLLGYAVLSVRTSTCIPKRKGEAQLSVQHGTPREML